MVKVHFLEPDQFEVVNEIGMRIGRLAGSLGCLKNLVGWANQHRQLNLDEVHDFIETLRRDARAIEEYVGDHL